MFLEKFESNDTKPLKLVCIKEILKKMGISNTLFHVKIKKMANFPTPIYLSDGKPRFLEAEIDDWILNLRKSYQPKGNIHKIK
jgi:predicted DNA-binding transcriptional regulator AlpA